MNNYYISIYVITIQPMNITSTSLGRYFEQKNPTKTDATDIDIERLVKIQLEVL